MNAGEKSVSIIIASLNEESNVGHAVEAVRMILESHQIDYEILAFNDGSTDKTGEILDELSLKNPRIRVVHHSTNQGLGVISREAFKMANKKYITWFPGDNAVIPDFFQDVMGSLGQVDIVVAYIPNSRERSLFRHVLSQTYTFILNTIFGLHVKYFNGPSIYPTVLAKSVDFTSNRFGFFAELLIRCLKKGATYTHVPFSHKARSDRSSKSISWKGVKDIFQTTCVLVKEVYFRK